MPRFLMPMVRKLENLLDLDLVLFTDAPNIAGLSAYALLYEYDRPKTG